MSLLSGITIGAFVAGEIVQTFRSRRGAKRVGGRQEVLFRLMLVAAILMLPLGPDVVPAANVSSKWAGLVVCWLGLLLRWWSFVTLGRYFTVVVMTSDDQPVVDRGPYRVLRHPSYTGLILAFAGVGLLQDNWVSAAGSALLILLALIYRLLFEERALSDALGDRYREFAAGRARLLPYVW